VAATRSAAPKTTGRRTREQAHRRTTEQSTMAINAK
jgi:hypothetical protein